MTLVLNSPTRMCCGKAANECKCGQTTNPFSPGYRPDPVTNDDGSFVVVDSGERAVGGGIVLNQKNSPRPAGGALGLPAPMFE